MPFCIKCGRRIKKKQAPWCDNCRIAIYQATKKVKNNKNKTMLNQILSPEVGEEETEDEEDEEDEE